MHGNTKRVIWTIGVAICLAICGCVDVGRPAPFLNPNRVSSRPRPTPSTEAVSDLRIPADPVPAPQTPATDIPLVPVPPPPLQGDRPREPAAPALTTATPTNPMTKAAPPLPPMLTPQELYEQARTAFAPHDSLIARLTRREPGKGKKGEQILAFTFRKEPYSIRFKWLAGDGAGRDVLYVKGRYENKIHTLLAAGDMPLAPPGSRIALPVDNPLVKAANNHSITEAGIAAIIDYTGKVLEAKARGNLSLGKFTSLGLQQRPDYEGPLYMLEQSLPPGAEADAPRGGRRLMGFSPENHLPVLSVLFDERDQEIDYARFDRLMLSVKLDDADFDPEQLGKRPDTPAENALRR